MRASIEIQLVMIEDIILRIAIILKNRENELHKI